jgi:hypothetical protein
MNAASSGNPFSALAEIRHTRSRYLPYLASGAVFVCVSATLILRMTANIIRLRRSKIKVV